MSDTNDLEVKMLALLERWVQGYETSSGDIPGIYRDTKTLLKEAKAVKHGN